MEEINTNNNEVLNLICKKVTRIEVIDNKAGGRQFVQFLSETETLEFRMQDNNGTLKIFINH